MEHVKTPSCSETCNDGHWSSFGLITSANHASQALPASNAPQELHGTSLDHLEVERRKNLNQQSRTKSFNPYRRTPEPAKYGSYIPHGDSSQSSPASSVESGTSALYSQPSPLWLKPSLYATNSSSALPLELGEDFSRLAAIMESLSGSEDYIERRSKRSLLRAILLRLNLK